MISKREFKQHIQNNIAPFESGTKNVIVQLLPEQVEDYKEIDIAEDRDLICMNVLTLEKLSYDREFLNSNEWDNYISSRYLFSAELNETEKQQYQSLLDSVDENNFACVKIIEYDYMPSPDEHIIRGNLEIIIGERVVTEGLDIPFSIRASICWTNNTVSMQGNGNAATIARGNITSINNGINRLNSELPPMGVGGDDGSNHGKVRIYNVGSGNMVSYLQDDGRSLLFDCGASYTKVGNSFTGITQYDRTKNHVINYVKPNYIIISHWHLDHYVYIDMIKRDNLQGIVIPNYDNVDYSFKIKVQSFGKPIFNLGNIPFDENFISSLGFPKVKIFKGLGLTAPANGNHGVIYYSNRAIDDNGLLLSIGDGYQRIILPGDCSYYSWPQAPELDLSNTCKLLVPHHGGHIITKAFAQNNNKYRDIYVSTSYQPPLKDLNNTKGNTHHGSFIRGVYPNVKSTTTYHFTCNCSNIPYYEITI